MKDYLIIGQGLAGSILAKTLLDQGKQILILDNGHKHCASTMAAGLIQPILGHYLTCPEHIDGLLSSAVAYYKALEKEWGTTLINPIACYRVLNEKQIKKWNKKKEKTRFKSFLGDKLISLPYTDRHSSQVIQIRSSYVVYPEKLLRYFKDFFIDKKVYEVDQFNESDLNITSDDVSYKSQKAKKIILAMGDKVSELSLLKKEDFQSIKGETLTLKALTPELDHMVQSKEWIVPHENGIYRVGATYDKTLTDTVTPEAKEVLEDFLRSVDINAYEIIKQEAGIRCVTQNQKPLATWISERVGVFTGFGSKGFLTCPYETNLFLT